MKKLTNDSIVNRILTLKEDNETYKMYVDMPSGGSNSIREMYASMIDKNNKEISALIANDEIQKIVVNDICAEATIQVKELLKICGISFNDVSVFVELQ